MPKPFKLVLSLIISQFAGFIGSIFTTPNLDPWYTELNKPSFNPPNWIFAPVWLTLYLLMGIALYLVWTKPANKHLKIGALVVFFIQLILNALWSILFFGLQSPFYALIEIVILLGFISLTIIYFYRVSKPAAYLLIPYILWVGFATVLNFSIASLN